VLQICERYFGDGSRGFIETASTVQSWAWNALTNSLGSCLR
jgi:hypothetical protein